MADNFESNTFAAWTEVDQEGDASATISTTLSHSGNCAGKLVVTTSPTSMAYIRKDLGGNKTEVWASGWFDVPQAGVVGNDVPYLRFFDGVDRIVDVFRQNSGGGAWLRTADGSGSWNYQDLHTPMPVDTTWHQVTLHVAPNGATSTIDVWIDGSSVYSSTTFDLHTTVHLSMVQLGAEHVSQQMVEYFDDICIGAS